MLAATLGAGLEFYDFITFAFFAIQIGHTFFPSTDRYASLIGALAAFGAGFLTRPLGAWVLGRHADRVGRKPALLASMMIMGAGITVLALTPGFATIGYAAPAIAVLCRMAQGFAFGGEIGCASAYMIEASDPTRRAWAISMQAVSQFTAAAIASLIGALLAASLDGAALEAWGWRVALLVGVLVVPVALVLRSTLPETLPDNPAAAFDAFFASHLGAQARRRTVLFGAGLMATGTIATYFFNYTATFGQNELRLSAAASLTAQLGINAIAIVGSLAGGWLADRYGRRALLIAGTAPLILGFVPGYGWIIASHGLTALLTVNVVLSFFANLSNAASFVTIAEAVPTDVRSRVFGLAYNLPIALFGGTTQLVLTWLLEFTRTPMSIAWYVTGVQVVALLLAIAIPETWPAAARRRPSSTNVAPAPA